LHRYLNRKTIFFIYLIKTKMKTINTYQSIKPTATGICPVYRWGGMGVLIHKGIEEFS
jgi:hypothetical protein